METAPILKITLNFSPLHLNINPGYVNSHGNHYWSRSSFTKHSYTIQKLVFSALSVQEKELVQYFYGDSKFRLVHLNNETVFLEKRKERGFMVGSHRNQLSIL